ncbi:serine hydrolase domain-containing protein [Pseudomonas sp. F1_0610]|uniref:serine hydrolase domain-containing protein n=1 Tax=Pseudomonas sp. F1_0610 TaxID=3114284 RepID=UPI0039C1FE7E
MPVQGYFDLTFESVKEAFAQLFENDQQRGAALCVQIAGETVIDLWAGTTDRERSQAWQQDTLVNVFSSTKPFAAVVLMQLVAEGKLELDAPVSQYWPEFVAKGKQDISVRHLLSHRSGISAIHQSLPAESLYHWQAMVQAIEQETPWWTPNTTHGYAPITYGWLVGELIRRVDGRMPGDAIAARICQPLNLDFFVGTPASEFYRISDVSRMKGDIGDEAAQRMLQTIMREPNSLTTKSFTNPPSVMTSTNKPEWRLMQQPAANGHGNARSLAQFYTALLNNSLLEQKYLLEMCKEHSFGMDKTMLTSTRIGLGLMLDQTNTENATYGMTASAFGHPGAGGTTAFADPQLNLSFSFVTNSLGPYVLMDPRAQRLARLVKAVL